MTFRDLRQFPHGTAAIAAVAAAIWPSANASAQVSKVSLAPHAAVYRFVATNALSEKLQAVSPPRVVGDGAETVELRRTCKGWRYRQEMKGTLRRASKNISAEYALSWFESADGRRFTYAGKSSTEAKNTSATATLPESGPGKAVVVVDDTRKTLMLSQGTIFPATKMKCVLYAARTGDLPIYVTVFQGEYKNPLGANTIKAKAADPGILNRLPTPLRVAKAWQFEEYSDRPDGSTSDTVETKIIADNGIVLERNIFFRWLRLRWILRSVR